MFVLDETFSVLELLCFFVENCSELTRNVSLHEDSSTTFGTKIVGERILTGKFYIVIGY